MFVIKIPIKNKTHGELTSKGKIRKRSAAKLKANYYIFIDTSEPNLNILGFNFEILLDSEVNLRHQPSWSKKQRNINKRKQLFKNTPYIKDFKESTNPNTKSQYNRNLNKYVNQINNCPFFEITMNDLYGLFKGSNPSGAETSISDQEIVLDLPESKFDSKPFINLLKTFTKKNNIKRIDKAIPKNVLTFTEFITLLNEEEKYIFNYYYNNEIKSFYFRHWKEYIVNYDSKNNSKLKPLLVQKYGEYDQLYKKYKNQKVVEGCHLKPQSHTKKDNTLTKAQKQDEINNTNNGLLLPAHIHKLLDGGYIAFSNEGKILFEKLSKTRLKDFGIIKSEYSILKLPSLKLDKILLTPERLKYIKYHRENVYQKGI